MDEYTKNACVSMQKGRCLTAYCQKWYPRLFGGKEKLSLSPGDDLLSLYFNIYPE